MPDVVAKVTTEFLQAFADAWNRHDVDALMSFMTDDCVFEASAGPDVCGTRFAGREAVRAGFAKADRDAQPLTPKQLKAMVPMRALRGRPKSPHPKQLVSVRYSPEVLAFLRATGEGWQSRMDGVLRQYVAGRSRQA